MTSDPIAARLDGLLSLTPIPEWHRANDWPAVEAELGITLPAEYKAYADRFPSGVHRRLDVFHPGCTDWPLVDELRQYAKTLASYDPDRAFYPRPGGHIPWAEFESNAFLCWLPEGADDPDGWPVVACTLTGVYEDVPGSTLQALAAVLRGDAGRQVFPDYFYDDPLTFQPIDPHVSVTWGHVAPTDIGE